MQFPYLTDDWEWRWASLAYAAMQPRGNELWARLVNQTIRDIEQYLAHA